MRSQDVSRTFLLVFLLGALLLGSSYAARRGYVSLRQAKLLKQARGYLAKAEGKKALFCLQRALRANPKDVEAVRLMAELAERGRSPGAVLWRGRAVELAPASVEDRLALARTALTFRDLITASNALEAVSDTGKRRADYHNVAGTLSISTGGFASAEEHFLQASRLEPTNPVPRLNLSVVRLRETNAAAAAQGRLELKQLTSNPAVNCQALRELVADAVRQRQTNEALHLARQLAEATNCAFSDKLVRMELLRSTGAAEFQSYLTRLQREAATGPGKVYELAAWQMITANAVNALTWMATLPAGIRTNQVVALMGAQCRAALQDWRGLLVAAEQENWAELDFVRHAFMARAMKILDLASSSKTEWEHALKAANGRREGLIMLLQLAGEWNWPSEQEQVLWTLVNQFPGERWANAGLAQVLFARGRTQALLTLFGQLARAHPADLSFKNNLALTALLLDAQQLKPHQIAREVYEKAPTNASYASTYAYSLYLQEKRAEALKVIEQLQPQELEKPSIAAYYGLLLQASGYSPKARKYFSIAATAALLPEERRLLQRAMHDG